LGAKLQIFSRPLAKTFTFLQAYLFFAGHSLTIRAELARNGAQIIGKWSPEMTPVQPE
jgi:hypothetical protein